jgi:hypothetical protein
MYRLIALLISSFLFTAGVTIAAELTSDDLLYLEKNEIYVPKDLSSSQMIGLHDVINDPKTKVDPQTRLKNVNHYLDVAMATILACTVNPKHPDCRKCADCRWNRRTWMQERVHGGAGFRCVQSRRASGFSFRPAARKSQCAPCWLFSRLP